ncbi:glutathione S-transferase N-terminal domain-containing protein [Polyangium mundeleinium]|uniref:Glutathione S-transferase N-terminal domain-containing protein n=1 Tax=Polyangium mundeleinium TaxID=2995306 RepID=A0ABT5EW82_9BACT|nr:glutathione S-transferase N-terminal domain-containing protein [Polyangium mundeleinium]MDC0745689.1 glutathione S-transferase N-terminal domain-containing protein [Polyangium mundeleinium]
MTILLYDLVAQGDRRPSPFCFRTKLALAHKRLAFETAPVAMTDIQALEGGAFKTVPILKDGAHVVGDSWAIADYLDQAYPDRPPLFHSPEERGLCRFLDAWLYTSVLLPIVRFYVKDIHDLLLEKDHAYFRASREARLGCTLEEAAAGREARLDVMRAGFDPARLTLTHQGQPFLSGQNPGYADFMLAGVLLWVETIGTVPLLVDGDPLVTYLERVRAPLKR